MARGGKRIGAGKPIGSCNKPKFYDYITIDEIKQLVAICKKQAKKKPELLRFVLEHTFGKAPQNINVGGQEDNPLDIGIILYPQKNEGILATTTETRDSLTE